METGNRKAASSAILNGIPVVKTNGLQRAAGIGTCKAMPVDAKKRNSADDQVSNPAAVIRG
jgi:hypothetical protein